MILCALRCHSYKSNTAGVATYHTVNEYKGRTGDFRVENDTIGFTDTANADDRISGMVVEGSLSTLEFGSPTIDVHQGMVESGAASGMSSPVIAKSYDGFSGGIMMQGDGAATRIKSSDVAITTDAIGNVGASMNYTYVDSSSIGTAGTSNAIDFGNTAGTNNAAIQNTIYAAQAEPAFDGAIMSGTNNADITICSACTYAHWGVWSIHNDNASAPITDDKFTALVPYVAGERYNSDINTALGPTGNVVYEGQAMANFAVNSTGTEYIYNRVGTMSANINLDNRKIATNNFSIQFVGANAVNGQNINFTNNADAIIDSSGDFNILLDGNVGVTPFSGGDNAIAGTFYGPNAKDIGGYFSIGEVNVSGDLYKGAGVYLGTCNGVVGGC